jgi:hypothetical protein
MQHKNITETVGKGDLKRLVHDEIHVDQFKSKMGRDEDIVVISFKVKDKEPALDLVDFIEKGYQWVLDADVSAGEKDDGSYIVFVEVERGDEVPEQLLQMLKDLENLTELSLDDWRWRYAKQLTDHIISEEEFREYIPLTPEAYLERTRPTKELDKLKAVSGVPVNTRAPVNDLTESLRIAAGIK